MYRLRNVNIRRFSSYCKFLHDLSNNDYQTLGTKIASISMIMQDLKSQRIKVPNGFVINSKAFKDFVSHNNLQEKINQTLMYIDTSNINKLQKAGAHIRQQISEGQLTQDMQSEIKQKYEELGKKYQKDDIICAVRSSASYLDEQFIGQNESYMGISGTQNIYKATLNCFASLYTTRNIAHCKSMGYEMQDLNLSVCVQRMVRSDLGASGIAWSVEPKSGSENVIVIKSIIGLGDIIQQGTVIPDYVEIVKQLLESKYSPIACKKLGEKNKKLIFQKDQNPQLQIVKTTDQEQTRFALDDKQYLALASIIKQIETHYSVKLEKDCPMCIEWAYDIRDDQFYILQANPVCVQSNQQHKSLTQYYFTEKVDKHPFLLGTAIGQRIGAGKARVIKSLDNPQGQQQFNLFDKGDVLVTDFTDKRFLPVFQKASAVITNKGGRGSHAAVMSRELQIPTIVGVNNATEIIKSGDEITVSCAIGEKGRIYKGLMAFEQKDIMVDDFPQIKTPVKLKLNVMDKVYRRAMLPNFGLGIGRIEKILIQNIGYHPNVFIDYDRKVDIPEREEIRKLIKGYSSAKEYYKQSLIYGIAKFGAAFYPKQATIRFNDLTSEEFLNALKGSERYEMNESNPIIGLRGASRYISEQHQEAFILECQAIRAVREEVGLMNVNTIMIPFVRTLYGLEKCLQIMEANGLKRGQDLKVCMIVEVPLNVILADKFIKLVDGFCIGTNDLTQLTLAIDKDSAQIFHIHDLSNEGIKEMILRVIQVAKDNNKSVGITGTTATDFPDFLEFLVQNGIDYITVMPGNVAPVWYKIHEIESRINKS